MWSRLNDLSFLTVNSLISLNVPGVVQILQKIMYSLIYVDVLQTDKWLIKAIYKGDEQATDVEALNIHFEENGF